jgi:hypothetical protein
MSESYWWAESSRMKQGKEGQKQGSMHREELGQWSMVLTYLSRLAAVTQ